MIHLDLARPLASLLDVCRAAGIVTTQAQLGERHDPPVDQGCVARTMARGDRIKLSTLAAYARAAGYTLWVGARRRRAVVVSSADYAADAFTRAAIERVLADVSAADELCLWNVFADARAAEVTVGPLRDLLREWGLEMTLAVERG